MFDPAVHHRRSIRLKGYDYSQPGAYFVTVCTHRNACVLGEVAEDEVILSDAGLVVQESWVQLPDHYSHVGVDAFVVMPNHVHGIIVLHDANIAADVEAGLVGAGLRPAPTAPAPTVPTGARHHGLPEIVRAFKAFSARRINECERRPGRPIWQRGYYEHIIRNDKSWDAIRRYIESNPARWQRDPENVRSRLWQALTQ